MTQHLHFMGIGGIGMSGLARHYHAEGYAVSGCDAAAGAMVEALRNAGINVRLGHDPAHLEGVDLLVSTMAAPNSLIPGSVEEIEAAGRLGIRSIKRMELLGRLFGERDAIGVAGSHGKSTITGMLATIFVELADDPSVQLGANLPLLGGNMRHGRGRYLVAEVDESDPGFARLDSFIAVLPNLDDDHVAGDYPERRNYHASLADLEAAACSFADRATRVLYCRDSESLDQLLGGKKEAATYGFAPDSDYRIALETLTPGGSRFTLHLPDGGASDVELHVPGLHNAQNAGAALAAADLAGLPVAEAARVLAGFRGVGRRWQSWGELRGALVIDDYAVHPTEVATILAAARNTGRRVRAVLQPHRWVRTALHWRALADAAATAADEVLVLDIYAAGEAPIAGISPDLIVERLLAAGKEASRHDADSATRYLQETASEGDLVITLGAGDVWRVAARLVGGDAD